MRESRRKSRDEGYGTCGDAGAPGEVTQAQLDELHIQVTAEEEE